MKDRLLRTPLLILVILLAISGCSTTTVMLVRHAEKGQGADPPLTAAGQARAQELVAVVQSAGLSAIYTTQFLRTRQTAAPTVSATGILPTVIPVTGTPQDHASQVAADILSNHVGDRVLVVGHSDTVPLIIRALGGPGTSIGSREFDRLFVVLKRQRQSAARLINADYGP